MTIGPAMANMVALGCTIVPLFGLSKRLWSQEDYASTRTDGNVSFKLDILADNGFRVNSEFITASSLMRIGVNVTSARTAHMGGIRLYFGR